MSEGGSEVIRLLLVLFVALSLALPVSVAAETSAQTCPGFERGGDHAGDIEYADISESSGLAVSRRYQGEDGIIWTHNDSGDTARIFAMGTDGSHQGVVHLEGIEAVDWEDMSLGPCSVQKAGDEDADGNTPTCLYLGDIGDNEAVRPHVTVYRLREPQLPEDRPVDLTVKASDITAIHYRYEDGARDAETLMVHPTTGRLYVVDKSRTDGISQVYRVPNPADPTTSPEAPAQAPRIGQLDFSDRSGFAKMTTAGDIAPSGKEFSIRTYTKVYTYCVPDGKDFEAVFSAERTLSQPPPTIQGEALAYAPDGHALWLTSERRPAPLWKMTRAEPAEQEEKQEQANDDTGTEAPDAGMADTGVTDAGTEGSTGEDAGTPARERTKREERSGGCLTTSGGSSGLVLVVLVWVGWRRRT